MEEFDSDDFGSREGLPWMEVYEDGESFVATSVACIHFSALLSFQQEDLS